MSEDTELRIEALRKEYEIALQREFLAKQLIAVGQKVSLKIEIEGVQIDLKTAQLLLLPAVKYFSRDRIIKKIDSSLGVTRLVNAVINDEHMYLRHLESPVFTLRDFLEVCTEQQLLRAPNIGTVTIELFKKILEIDGFSLKEA